jgi:uroporphyrinogen III methyltransferase/synthase
VNKGKVYLVGAGPGDPDLITVKGLKAIKLADVIVFDRLLSKDILELFPEKTERIYVGKSSSKHVVPQEKIGKILVENALKGKKVVRLKGGDPFLFGRGGEEAQELKNAGISFEIVNGVTSAIAGPSYAGIPVTHRHFSSSVAFVTGHEDPSKENNSVNWEKLATAVDTIVVLMGVSRIDLISSSLMSGGLSKNVPVAIIQWGTTKRQRTIEGRLGDIAKKVEIENISPPALLIIGDVVKLRKDLSWFEGKNNVS